MSVRIPDPLHGEVVFEEPVLCELVESAPMQRIRDVDMGAYSRAFFPGSGFSRFEHSVGVCQLLALAGASLEEQVHGLLHDVNHTVFSHAVDYILEEGSQQQQSYQDDHYREFFDASPLPGILRRHGLDPDYVVAEEHFRLEERPLPELCADRLDYSLRSLFHYRLRSVSEVRQLLAGLENDAQRWFFADQDAAAAFARAFSELDDTVFDSFRSGVMYRSIGDCVGHALRSGVLEPADLLTTDAAVVRKLEVAAPADARLDELWKRMNDRVPAVLCDDANAVEVSCKSRIVDPCFRAADGSLRRLSEADPAWIEVVAQGMIPKRYRFRYVASAAPGR